MPFGTIPNYFHELAKEFRENGYKVILILDDQPIDLPDDQKWLVHKKWPNRRPTGRQDFAFFMRLLWKEKPLLVLSNFGSMNIVTLCSFLCGVPNRWNYIHTLHSQIQTDLAKVTFFTKVLHYRKKILYRLVTQFLTNAVGTKNDVVDKFGVARSKIDVGSYLIPASTITYKQKEERSSNICIVARLHKSKGHEVLLEQFRLLLKAYPEVNLNIVGDGHQKAALTQLCKEKNIESKVNFLGNVPNHSIGEIYSDCLVSISSSYYEAFGIVNIEALREGTPIICTKTSGSLDIIVPGQNGAFFDLEDHSSLTESFKIILQNWEHYSKGAMTTFKENYSLENLATRVERMDKLLIKKK